MKHVEQTISFRVCSVPIWAGLPSVEPGALVTARFKDSNAIGLPSGKLSAVVHLSRPVFGQAECRGIAILAGLQTVLIATGRFLGCVISIYLKRFHVAFWTL